MNRLARFNTLLRWGNKPFGVLFACLMIAGGAIAWLLPRATTEAQVAALYGLKSDVEYVLTFGGESVITAEPAMDVDITKLTPIANPIELEPGNFAFVSSKEPEFLIVPTGNDRANVKSFGVMPQIPQGMYDKSVAQFGNEDNDPAMKTWFFTEIPKSVMTVRIADVQRESIKFHFSDRKIFTFHHAPQDIAKVLAVTPVDINVGQMHADKAWLQP